MLDVGSCAVGCSRLSRRFHPLTQPVWAEAVGGSYHRLPAQTTTTTGLAMWTTAPPPRRLPEGGTP